jgi:hypothetical protein
MAISAMEICHGLLSETRRQGKMIKPKLDPQRLFDASPGCCPVLAPDFPRSSILAATKTRRDGVLGRVV